MRNFAQLKGKAERLKVMSRELLPWAGMTGMGYLLVTGELAQEAQKALVLWGPAILLIFMGWQYLPSFIESQKQNAAAMTDVAASLRNLPQRDELRFQEILIGQQLTLDEIKAIASRIAALEELTETLSHHGRSR